MSELLPTYNQLLREAFSASEAVDQFDLDSKDLASAAAWSDLMRKERVAHLDLAHFVHANYALLVREWI